MKAGSELDALIAEKVMGLKCLKFDSEGYVVKYDKPELLHIPYSTSIAHAWEVVEKMCEEKNSNLSFYIYQYNGEKGTEGVKRNWRAAFYDQYNQITSLQFITDKGESAPHAICIAALKAIDYNPST